MRCPSCRAELPKAAPQCWKCRLNLRRLDIRFGAVPRHSRFVTDRSGTLPLRSIKELRQLLNLFHRKFPQSLFSAFVVNRVENGTISEYVFWLANRARFSSVEAIGRRNFDILLGIDLASRTAALQVGYGLENYVNERDLERALARASAALAEGDVAGGIRECVGFMTDRMREVALEIETYGMPQSGVPIIVQQ